MALTLINKILNLLNEALDLDNEGFGNMILNRQVINADLANHPTIQVGASDDDSQYFLSPLGFINGLFDDGNEAIAAVVDKKSNKILEFIIVNLPAESEEI